MHTHTISIHLLYTSRVFFIFKYFFVPCGKFRSPYLGKAQQPQEQHYPFLLVYVVFPCVQTMVCLPVFGIFKCVHRCWGMWLHTWGCTGTIRESASEADSGKKSLATHRTRTHVSVAPGFSVRHSTELSAPTPSIKPSLLKPGCQYLLNISSLSPLHLCIYVNLYFKFLFLSVWATFFF